MPVPIISQAGPLPVSGTFSVPTNDPISILVSGSVWTQKANQMIGFTIQLDGKPIGAAQIYANPTAYAPRCGTGFSSGPAPVWA